jgi:hypothetical protein
LLSSAVWTAASSVKDLCSSAVTRA